MAKKRNDYFELMKNQVEFCVKAAELLASRISQLSSENINEFKEEMHMIEHQADDVHHDILTKLSAEFITPIDQEDILRLVQIIDDITDAIDEVTLDFYMYNLKKAPYGAHALSKTVCECVNALFDSVAELKNFKKPEKLRRHLVTVNTNESRADEVYIDAIHTLFSFETDAKLIIGHKAIYESLENCCDLCEHAADLIEQIVIKNT